MPKYSPTAGGGTWDKENIVQKIGIALREMRVSKETRDCVE